MTKSDKRSFLGLIAFSGCLTPAVEKQALLRWWTPLSLCVVSCVICVLIISKCPISSNCEQMSQDLDLEECLMRFVMEKMPVAFYSHQLREAEKRYSTT